MTKEDELKIQELARKQGLKVVPKVSSNIKPGGVQEVELKLSELSSKAMAVIQEECHKEGIGVCVVLTKAVRLTKEDRQDPDIPNEAGLKLITAGATMGNNEVNYFGMKKIAQGLVVEYAEKVVELCKEEFGCRDMLCPKCKEDMCHVHDGDKMEDVMCVGCMALEGVGRGC